MINAAQALKRMGLPAGIVLGLIALVVAANSYLTERTDRIRLDAELRATQQLLQVKDRELSGINHEMRDRDRQTAEMVKKIEELKARPATIREIVREIPQYIQFEKPIEFPPGLAPPAVFSEAPTKPAAPEAPSQITLDEGQAQDLRKFYLDCHRATLELRACQENAEDWGKKETLWQEKERVLIQQREAAIRAVKGGSFWLRVKRNAKWFAAGAMAGGILGVAASR